MAPWLAVFVDPKDQESAMYNNFRVFGTGLLCVMGKWAVRELLCCRAVVYVCIFGTIGRYDRVHRRQVCQQIRGGRTGVRNLVHHCRVRGHL